MSSFKELVVPDGVDVFINSGKVGVVHKDVSLEKKIDKRISVEKCGNFLRFTVKDSVKDHVRSSLLGLWGVLFRNMFVGVCSEVNKSLEIVGVGYKVGIIGNDVLNFDLGYSHTIFFCLPDGIHVNVSENKGENTIINVFGHDKELVGSVASKIKELRPVEPYKGKGIRYAGEFVIRKEGKKVVK